MVIRLEKEASKTGHVYWVALDGLRAIALSIVLLGHGYAPYVTTGWMGVDIFFVLSGFLITGILSREFTRYGNIRFRNFYARRAIRLSPTLILACILAVILSQLHGERFPIAELAKALTYTTNWFAALDGAKGTWLLHTWSLAIEEQYYLIWPLVILLLEKTVKGHWRKGLILVIAATALAAYRASMVGHVSFGRIYFGLDTHMDGLVLGSAFSYLVTGALRRQDLLKKYGWIFSHIFTPLAIGVLLILLPRMQWTGNLFGWIGCYAVAISSAILIADLVASPRSLIRPILSLAPLTYVGRISYGVYLFHLPIFHILHQNLREWPIHTLLPLKIILSIGISALSYHFIESRILRYKTRFVRAKAEDTRPEERSASQP